MVPPGRSAPDSSPRQTFRIKLIMIDFRPIDRKELRAAAELATRAFEDYEYFTNYFPDAEERRKVLRSVIYREYLTNFGRVHLLSACIDGKMVATAQLNPPDYIKPSDFQYLLHGWMLVYRGVNRQRLDDWLAMDAAAGKPCHDYQKTGEGIWYASSLTVDPCAQGTGIGTAFIAHWEDFIREHGGKELVFFTNSEKNIAYYLKRGFEVFHEEEFIYDGKRMGSWSVRKKL